METMFKLIVFVSLLTFSIAKECGRAKFGKAVDHWQRIIGGENAVKGSWPWQVSLRFRDEHRCGAVIIGNQWVITAAHCLIVNASPTTLVVRIGEHSLSAAEGTEQDYEIARVIFHEKFSLKPMSHDVALIKLKQKLKYVGNDFVNTVCLPDKDDYYWVGQKCVTTGWGITNAIGNYADILQEVTVPIIAQHSCNKTYEHIYPVTSDMMCAGGFEGGCTGDSGGPLVCQKFDNKDGSWHLVGVTSWGFTNCAQGPTVYSRIQYFLPWIKEVIAEN